MDFKARRVLVTGGAGFVGSKIVERLLALEASVTVLDDFFTGRAENLPAGGGYALVRGTVCDPDAVERAVGEAEFVVHAAARNIIVSTRNPREDFETNIGGTLNVLMAARRSKVKRIVYTSSASVYGNPRHLPINEDEGVSPLSPYSVSKLAGEHYCLAFYESYGVPATVVRYSNIYGPNQSPENPYCGVVARFVEGVSRGEAPQIHGDGEQTRDFTYVDDAVEGTLMALASPRSEGHVFNLGTGTETTVNQLARLIMELYGSDIPPVYIDRRDIDNIRRRVLNIESARKVLRWVPSVTLREGLRRTIAWHEHEGQARKQGGDGVAPEE
ncbi:MAG TPA: NAD-dependent epimerase/dehydratase family protein [Planctomycetota bacterium]|nr:NAD-dependent epimerase/dehydratase family protein [Planctomycetota bacterium]